MQVELREFGEGRWRQPLLTKLLILRHFLLFQTVFSSLFWQQHTLLGTVPYTRKRSEEYPEIEQKLLRLNDAPLVRALREMELLNLVLIKARETT